MKLLESLLIESTTIQTPTYTATLRQSGEIIDIRSNTSTLAGFIALNAINTIEDERNSEYVSDTIEFDVSYLVSLDGDESSEDFLEYGKVTFETNVENAEDSGTPSRTRTVRMKYLYWEGINRVEFYKKNHIEFLNILNGHGMKINENDLNAILMKFGDDIIEYIQN